jgi:hypothetical protein
VISISNDTLFLSDGGFAVLPADNDQQQLSLNGDTLFLQNGGFVILTDSVGVDTDDQTLSINGDTLFIADGNFVILSDNVIDADADSTNELQTLTISNDTVFLSNGGFVVLPSGAVDTDDQTLSINGDTLFIADGNFIRISDIDSTNELQVLSLSNDTLFLSDGGFVLLTEEVNDADSDSTNEIQFLLQNGDTIFLTNGGFVIIPPSQDHDWYEVGTSNSPTNINQDVYTLGDASVGLNSSGFARLDVMGNNNADHAMQLRAGDDWNSATTNTYQILFGWNGSANYRHALGTRHQAAGKDGNAIDFYLWDNTQAIGDIGGKRVMTIDARDDGMVGIGTATPRSELHISDGSPSLKAVNDAGGYGASILITDNVIPRIYFEEANSAANRKLMDIRTQGGIMRVDALNDVGSAYTLQNIFTIDRDGFVGVMTANPVEELHVTGSIRMVDGTQANGYVMTSDVNGTGSWQDPALLFPGSTNNWQLTGNAGTSSGTNFLGTTDLTSLVLRTNNVERVRVDSVGQVGINQNNPAHTLHVVGDERFEGDFINQEMLGVHSGTVQSVPFTNLAFTPLTGTTVSITPQDGNGVNNSAVLITGFARVFGGNLDGSNSSLGGYFMLLERDTNPAFTGATILTYTSGICYIETPDGGVSASIGFGGGGHISYVDAGLVAGTTYYYRLTLVPNSVGITSGTFDVYQRDLNIIQLKR